MDGMYRVKFEECGGFVAGDVVCGHRVGVDQRGLDYLVGVGAVELVEGVAPEGDLPAAPVPSERVEDVEAAHSAALIEDSERAAALAASAASENGVDLVASPVSEVAPAVKGKVKADGG